MKNTTAVQCPNCGTSIDVNDILKHQIEEGLRKEFEQKAKSQEDALTKKLSDFNKAKEDFEKQKQQQDEIFAEKLAAAKKDAEAELHLKIKKQLEDEQKDSLDALQKELNEKSEKIQKLNKLETQVAKLEREKREMRDELEAEAEKSFNEKLSVERERIAKLEKDKFEFREKELQKQIDDQKKLTEEMKRKQEQGSMQLQGEVMELAIEEYLAQQFPLDLIDEIKKGANGADCLQTVNTYEIQNCGTIYYESKRTKNFQPSWMEKFKADIREKKANIGVLVTEVLPAGMERMGMRDGIWICTFDEFKGLVMVLRQSLIQVAMAVQNQENKGDKMSMLYDFLTSDEFRHQIEGIVEGFSQMREDLEKEKRSTMSNWKKREKQIEKVISNTVNMYGSIRGIAGNAVQQVKALEIDEENLIEFD
ncbi:DUF2130 domain-containing protein [Chryseobacterium koreense]|uniref:Caldesmon n=1 Tax=Chryseobacterium koreense CCUG 49689 TaxID=1304281 RepID=A0A0J7IYD0_9FLAO|nr:DUF2130 domain-containing protein [Chryseobacterium koreense]KMQ70819.1 Caldesmon [Chryseobacterium koreense CCUG 49689]MBB5332543.1 hypothetical protein [Chryseobacterium koreense]